MKANYPYPQVISLSGSAFTSNDMERELVNLIL